MPQIVSRRLPQADAEIALYLLYKYGSAYALERATRQNFARWIEIREKIKQLSRVRVLFSLRLNSVHGQHHQFLDEKEREAGWDEYETKSDYRDPHLEPVPEGGFYRPEKRVAAPFEGMDKEMSDLFYEYDGWQPVEIRKQVVNRIPGYTAAFRNSSVGVVVIYSNGRAWVHYDPAGNQTEEHGTDIVTLDKFLRKYEPKAAPRTKEPQWNLSERIRRDCMVWESLEPKPEPEYVFDHIDVEIDLLIKHSNHSFSQDEEEFKRQINLLRATLRREEELRAHGMGIRL